MSPLFLRMMPHRLARISTVCFLAQIPQLLLHQALIRWAVPQWGHNELEAALAIAFFATFSGMFAALGMLSKNPDEFAVWWRSTFIGWAMAVGLHVSADPALARIAQFGWYVVFLAFFHWSEYIATALTNPSNLSTDSFLLNHSPAYHAAALLSWFEFFLEIYFYPPMKVVYVSYVGIVLCTCGEILRKLAMYHAGRSFNHIVQSTRREDHTLITDGVFRYARHPSYVGWFYWSLGTQIILVNPLCFVAYTIVSWLFFSERVEIEEYTLITFFGDQYLQYKKRVPTGLPFIQGYKVAHREEPPVEEKGDE